MTNTNEYILETLRRTLISFGIPEETLSFEDIRKDNNKCVYINAEKNGYWTLYKYSEGSISYIHCSQNLLHLCEDVIFLFTEDFTNEKKLRKLFYNNLRGYNDDEEIIINSLKRTLYKYNNLSFFSYCIIGYAEESVCLNKVSNSWEVCTYERDKKRNINEFSSIRAACLNLLEQICHSDEEAELKSAFLNRIEKADK